MLGLQFKRMVKHHYRAETMLIRHADDFICACHYRDDADRLYAALH